MNTGDFHEGAMKGAGGAAGKFALGGTLFIVFLVGLYFFWTPLNEAISLKNTVVEIEEAAEKQDERIGAIEEAIKKLDEIDGLIVLSHENEEAASELHLENIALRSFETDARGRLSRLEETVDELDEAAVSQRERALTRIGQHKARDTSIAQNSERLKKVEDELESEMRDTISRLQGRIRELEKGSVQ